MSFEINAQAEAGTGAEQCSWCGEAVERDDGFRLYQPAAPRRAIFCRLEHVVPWAMQGARWEPGTGAEPGWIGESLDDCAHCGAELVETRLVLVRHRGDHRVPDAFCSVDHLAAWATAGGRWR
jgi:hypothetical protein